MGYVDKVFYYGFAPDVVCQALERVPVPIPGLLCLSFSDLLKDGWRLRIRQHSPSCRIKITLSLLGTKSTISLRVKPSPCLPVSDWPKFFTNLGKLLQSPLSEEVEIFLNSTDIVHRTIRNEGFDIKQLTDDQLLEELSRRHPVNKKKLKAKTSGNIPANVVDIRQVIERRKSNIKQQLLTERKEKENV